MDAVSGVSQLQNLSGMTATFSASAKMAGPLRSAESFNALINANRGEPDTLTVQSNDQAELEKARTLKAFESMVISQFVGDIIDKQLGGMLGEGLEADMYSSMLSDAIAEKISEAGGIGISKLV